jgi:hypothetical protein
MEISRTSDFLPGSFRKYQWRETLTSCLAELTEGFHPKDPEEILREMERLTVSSVPSVPASPVQPRKFLGLISDRNMVPIGTKPHSIFFLCSEQNFVSACFDWLTWCINSTREIKVGAFIIRSMRHSSSPKFAPGDCKKMYSAICRLTEETWSKWNLSPEMQVILGLSKTLRDDRKRWKTEAHGNRNRGRSPDEQSLRWECRNCAHLERSQRCVRDVLVRESGLSSVLEHKVIIPEETNVISSQVSLNFPNAVRVSNV